MLLLNIGLDEKKCEYIDKLYEISYYFKEKDIDIYIEESKISNYNFIKYMINDKDLKGHNIYEIKNNFNILAAKYICELIVINSSMLFIKKILKNNYRGILDSTEIDKVANKCINIITGKVNDVQYNCINNIKSIIANKIYDYIQSDNEIILEGFIKFRLKNIYSDFEAFTDILVDDFMMEKEYNEFISLLKYFVEIQESNIDVLNIMICGDGKYNVYDSLYKDITEELLKSLTGSSKVNGLNTEDFLVSSLITAAPKSIIIHNSYSIINKDIINTIKNVFEDKVFLCTGCNLCGIKSKILNEESKI